MQLRTALAAGAAAMFLAGSAGLAWAASPRVHVLTVQLPGGGVEQIRYTGDVPPHIVLMPDAAPLAVAMAPMPGLWDAPFAAFDRIAAEMDRETTAMLQQADLMSQQAFARPDQMVQAGFGRMPANGASYSSISTFSGNGVCTRSVTITSQGNGAKPRVVSNVSGNCGPEQGGADRVALPSAHAPALQPGMVRVKAETPVDAGGAHPVAYRG